MVTLPGAAARASGTASTASGACSWTSVGAAIKKTTQSVSQFLFLNSNSVRREIESQRPAVAAQRRRLRIRMDFMVSSRTLESLEEGRQLWK